MQQVLSKEDEAMHIVQRLRSELFRIQVEGHAQEMHRMLHNRHGKADFSVELFRSMPQQEECFFPEADITRALDVLNNYFHFEFTPFPPERALRKCPIGDGYSIVNCPVKSPVAD